MYLETTQPAFWPAALLRRTSVFAAGENLGAGRIYFARAFKIKRGSHGACPVGIGMTDPFAIEQFSKLFIPMAWTVK